MKQLVSIDRLHLDRYRSIVSNKKDIEIRDRLQAVDAEVANRYTAFETVIDSRTIHSLVEDPFLQAMEDDLRSCYRIKTKGLRTIIEKIEIAQPKRLLERCPYCGITLPGTYDHYLPSSKFPELAVHGLNMVPCCTTCNEKKGNRWRNATQRWFIHFYSDIIPGAQFLFTALVSTPSCDSIGATFSIQRPYTILQSDWTTIQCHYDKLHLIDRYNEFAGEEINSAIDSCVDHLKDGGRSSTQFLDSMSNRLESIFGNNHWRVVLFRALSASQAFVNIVLSKV